MDEYQLFIEIKKTTWYGEPYHANLDAERELTRILREEFEKAFREVIRQEYEQYFK